MQRRPTIPLRTAWALAFLTLGLPAAASAQEEAPTIQTDPEGRYLTDGQGMSLYLFEADSENTSTCYDDCAGAWPPLLTEGEPTASGQIDGSKLSTIERNDGSTQVTYGGWPLYYFVRDQSPGETNGQDVEGFGAEWYLVTPEGEKYEG